MTIFCFVSAHAIAMISLLGSPASADISFNVRDYGATGNQRTNDRAAIQAAVDACARAGGGTVLFPPGDYLSSTIRLSSHVTLKIEMGATIWTSKDPTAFSGHRQLFFADGKKHIVIQGQGRIHGQGTDDYGARWGKPKRPPFRTGVLLFTNCQDVAVRNVTILYSDSWTLHFKRCERVVVEGVTIRNNYRRLNSDGIDPNMCRHVRISNCRITAGDDCIVLKATESHACEDVVVKNCELESAASAIKLGTESRGDFRDIRFEGCAIRNSFTGIGFYLKDGGTMERVSFKNIQIKTCPATVRTVTPVFMDIERRHVDSKVGIIRDVTFENLEIHSGSGVLIQGMPESPIRRLAFRNVVFRVDAPDDYVKRKKPIGGRRTTRGIGDTLFAQMPSYMTFAHVSRLTLQDVQLIVAGEALEKYDRSAVCLRHIESARLNRVSRRPSPRPGMLPVVDSRDCRDVAVDSP